MIEIRGLARDAVKQKEKQMIETIQKRSTELQKYIDDEVYDWMEERKKMLNNNEKQFKEIKLVCCKYFEKYDK